MDNFSLVQIKNPHFSYDASNRLSVYLWNEISSERHLTVASQKNFFFSPLKEGMGHDIELTS